MEQYGFKDILKALELNAMHIDEKMDGRINEFEKKIYKRINDLEEKFDKRINDLENNMNKRFDRLDTKYKSVRIDLSETQDTIDFLSKKVVQPEKSFGVFMYN